MYLKVENRHLDFICIGRDDEVSILREWIISGEKCICITGAPGVGKTTIGMAVLSEISDKYDYVRIDARKYANIDSFSIELKQIISQKSSEKKKAKTSGVELLEKTIQQLDQGQKPVIVCVDNYEDFEPSANIMLQNIISNSKNITLLVTSRSRPEGKMREQIINAFDKEISLAVFRTYFGEDSFDILVSSHSSGSDCLSALNWLQGFLCPDSDTEMGLFGHALSISVMAKIMKRNNYRDLIAMTEDLKKNWKRYIDSSNNKSKKNSYSVLEKSLIYCMASIKDKVNKSTFETVMTIWSIFACVRGGVTEDLLNYVVPKSKVQEDAIYIMSEYSLITIANSEYKMLKPISEFAFACIANEKKLPYSKVQLNTFQNMLNVYIKIVSDARNNSCMEYKADTKYSSLIEYISYIKENKDGKIKDDRVDTTPNTLVSIYIADMMDCISKLAEMYRSRVLCSSKKYCYFCMVLLKTQYIQINMPEAVRFMDDLIDPTKKPAIKDAKLLELINYNLIMFKHLLGKNAEENGAVSDYFKAREYRNKAHEAYYAGDYDAAISALDSMTAIMENFDHESEDYYSLCSAVSKTRALVNSVFGKYDDGDRLFALSEECYENIESNIGRIRLQVYWAEHCMRESTIDNRQKSWIKAQKKYIRATEEACRRNFDLRIIDACLSCANVYVQYYSDVKNAQFLINYAVSLDDNYEYGNALKKKILGDISLLQAVTQTNNTDYSQAISAFEAALEAFSDMKLNYKLNIVYIQAKLCYLYAKMGDNYKSEYFRAAVKDYIETLSDDVPFMKNRLEEIMTFGINKDYLGL